MPPQVVVHRTRAFSNTSKDSLGQLASKNLTIRMIQRSEQLSQEQKPFSSLKLSLGQFPYSWPLHQK